MEPRGAILALHLPHALVSSRAKRNLVWLPTVIGSEQPCVQGCHMHPGL